MADKSCNELIAEQLRSRMDGMEIALKYSEDELQDQIDMLEDTIEELRADKFALDFELDDDFAEQEGRDIDQAIDDAVDEKIELQDHMDSGDYQEGWSEGILSVDKKVTFEIMLSTGGPADWFEVSASGSSYNWDIDTITYHYQDWGDHAERTLRGDDYDTALELLQPILDNME